MEPVAVIATVTGFYFFKTMEGELRQGRDFQPEEAQEVRRLWLAGHNREHISKVVHCTSHQFDHARQVGIFGDLPSHKGQGNKGNRRRYDDESQQVLFGLTQAERDKRKEEITSQWSSEEFYFRSIGWLPNGEALGGQKPKPRQMDKKFASNRNRRYRTGDKW